MRTRFDGEDYVKNLPDAFSKTEGSNNARILGLVKSSLDELREAIRAVYDSLDIDKATGKSLDLFGDMVGQERGVATDEQYRAMIKSKICRNLANADHNSIVNAVCAVFGCEPHEVLLMEAEAPCTVTVEHLPFEALNKSNIDAATAIKIIKGLMPAGVKVESLSFTGTFEFMALSAVLESAEGSYITLDNCANAPFGGLELYGKTTQAATPTPTAPVYLENIAESGSITVAVAETGKSVSLSVTGGLPGIPMQAACTKHNYTDKNGQKWFTDEIDFARGVYIQRCFMLTFDGTEGWTASKSGKIMEISGKAIPALNNFDTGTIAPETGVCAYFMCSHYKAIPHTVSPQDGMVRSYGTSNGHALGFYASQYASTGNVDGWKQWLADQAAAGTPMTMVLGLRTPVETKLPEETLAAYRKFYSHDPNTTIYNDAGVPMKVSYLTQGYVPEYDEEKGFGNEDQTLGGYLGLLSDGEGSNLPV